MPDMKKWILPAAIIVVIGVACSLWPDRNFKMPSESHLQAAFPGTSREILEKSQQFTLISLHPFQDHGARAKDHWHGFRILGQTVITNPQERTDLIAALYDSMAQEGDSAACFNPRHGIRAVRDGKTVDLVICFACGNMDVHTPFGKRQPGVAKSSQKYFDDALRRAGVKMPDV